MYKIAKVALKNPVGLIACFAFLPLFLLYPGITMANLFLLIILILSYYLFLSQDRVLRSYSPIVLTISLLLYYFFAREDLSYIFVALSLAAVASLVYLAMSSGVSINQGRVAKRLFFVGLAILILLPITFNISLNFLLKNQVKELKRSALELDEKFKADNEHITKSLSDVGNDPFIIDLLHKHSYSDLTEYCQNIMVAKELDYMVITDENNMVVARIHKPKAVGDDYSGIMPEVKENNPASGISYESGRAFMASLLPLGSGGSSKIGSVVGGKFISEAYLRSIQPQNSGAALFGQLSLAAVSTTSNDLTGFIEQAKERAIPEEGKYRLYEYKGQNILLLDHQLPDGGGRLYLYSPVNLLSHVLLMNLAAFVLLVLLACAYVGFKKTSRAVLNLYHVFTAEKQSSAARKKAMSVMLEYLLFAFILALVWWRSSIAFYSGGVRGEQIKENQTVSATVDAPNLRLITSSYAKPGEETKTSLQVDNLKESPASVQATIKFDVAYVQATSIISKDGFCEEVYDKIIDNKTGSITFSCDLKNIDAPGTTAMPIADFTFKTYKEGIANFSIDDSYSYILTAHGKNNKITQTFPAGERLLIK